MGKREHYEPGTFCWVDLQTTDPAGAKTFYGGLFGWEAEDMPAGEGVIYSMMRLGGDDVCALNEMDAGQREQGVPPHWFSYVSVEDAAAAAARARELGGTVFGEAFDVLDAGRMALVQDPTGAMHAAWQPWRHIGARRVNDPGCLSLNQLDTHDPERAANFYSQLYGWDISQVNDEPPYWGIDNKGSLNGGMMRMPDNAQGAPSHWLVYFVAEELDAAAGKIEDLGGTIMVPPMEVPPQNRILVAQDPQGAAFGLFEGETDD